MEASPRFVITASMKRQLFEQGYLITPALFDEATLDAVRHEFLRLWHELIDQARGADELTLDQARHRPAFNRLHERSATCAGFCRHPALLDLCRQLIGPDADLSWNQAVVKPAASGDNSLAWHQDQYYALKGDYATDSDLAILESLDTGYIAWVAISRTTVDNGTVWLLPGRHREGLLPHAWSDARREWQGQYDTSWKIPAVMQPGQVLIMLKYLPHASGANVTRDETRMAYQLGYTVPGLKTGPSPDIVPLMRGGVALHPS